MPVFQQRGPIPLCQRTGTVWAAPDAPPTPPALRWAAFMGFVFALLAGVFVVPALGRIFA